jgi:hypothetical protein
MDYQYRTEIIWTWNGPILPEVITTMENQAAVEEGQGKTDGIISYDGDKRIRNWTTLEVAQAWVDWVNTLEGITIQSAEIVSNA